VKEDFPMTLTTQYLVVGSEMTSDPAIEQAAALIKAGEVVAFPTETVYGLGADATNPDAVEKIFVAKNRPSDNPIIVHVADMNQALFFAKDPSFYFFTLTKAFWPGPLTMVVPATDAAKRSVTRGLDTVALRMPRHPVALALAQQAGVGVAAPSANLSGRPSPTTAEHVRQDLDGRIPLILDGGSCQVGIESTVLDLTSHTPGILRPGQISAADLERVLGAPIKSVAGEEAKKRSPGTRYRHYAPDAPVWVLGPAIGPDAFNQLLSYLFESKQSQRIGYLGWRPIEGPHVDRVEKYAIDRGPRQLAHELYRYFRELDNKNVDLILVEGAVRRGLGIALMDRLEKAASQIFETERHLRLYMES
jgi:L-threonylcarbamoyladenylate synthase